MQTLTGRNTKLRGPVPSANAPTEMEENFPALKPLDSYRGTSAEQWLSTQAGDASQNQVITDTFIVLIFCLNLC